MNVSKFSVDLYRQIRPDLLKRYLKVTGWKNISTSIVELSVWRKGKNEIILPIDQNVSDYGVQIEHAVRKISIIDNLKVEDALNSIIEVGYDVLQLRAPLEGRQSGLFPVTECVRFYKSTYDLLIAAASAVVDNSPFFRSRKPKRAEEYIKYLQFATPEPGSYIVKVLSPVDYDEENSNIDLEFSRKVLDNIKLSVKTLSKASQLEQTLSRDESIQTLVYNGINANMCDALVGIAESSFSNNVSMSIRLAPMLTARTFKETPITFSTKQVDVVDKIAIRLKQVDESQTRNDYNVIGRIVALESPRDSQGGVVVIKESGAFGTRRKIKIKVDKPRYKKAISHHQANVLISVTGILTKDREYWLNGTSEILPSNIT